jgi:hypothetical protein
MNTHSKLLLFSFSLLGLLSCKSTEKTTTDSEKPMVQTVSYERDIKPIMIRSCTPCHYPEKGRKKQLDTYEAVSDNVSQIIKMVSLDPSDEHFMPYESKKQPLSEQEIELFKTWKAEGKGK